MIPNNMWRSTCSNLSKTNYIYMVYNYTPGKKMLNIWKMDFFILKFRIYPQILMPCELYNIELL